MQTTSLIYLSIILETDSYHVVFAPDVLVMVNAVYVDVSDGSRREGHTVDLKLCRNIAFDEGHRRIAAQGLLYAHCQVWQLSKIIPILKVAQQFYSI